MAGNIGSSKSLWFLGFHDNDVIIGDEYERVDFSDKSDSEAQN